MDVGGAVVFTKCISIACGGSLPLSFSDFMRIKAEYSSDNMMAICRIKMGSGSACLEESVCQVRSGDILVLGNSGRYMFTASECLLANLIVFDRRLFSSSYAYALGREAITPMLALARGCDLICEKDIGYREVLATVDTIWREAEVGDTASPLMAVAMLWQLAALLKRVMESRGNRSLSVREVHNRERLAPVINYIYKNYDKKITLADLARLANMSIPNFSSVFRETIGIPPMEYLTHLRLQNAANLLQNTDKKIIDIAEECGFFSISNFIKAFRNGMEMPPSQYRKECGTDISV